MVGPALAPPGGATASAPDPVIDLSRTIVGALCYGMEMNGQVRV